MMKKNEFKEEEKRPILSPLPQLGRDSAGDVERPSDELTSLTNLVNIDALIKPLPPEKVQVTSLDAFFLLANVMIGAGILVQATVIKSSGLIAGSTLFILVAIFTFIGVRLLTSLADVSGEREYGEIAYKAYGPLGALTVDLSIVIFNFTTVISYILYLGTLTSDIVSDYYPGDYWYTKDSFFSTVLTLGIVLPICLVRNFANLTIVAYFSIFMMVMVALIIVMDGSIETTPDWSTLTLISFSGSAMQLCNLVYSLGFAPAVLFVYSALHTRSKETMTNVNLSAVIFGTGLCLLIGITGYVLYGSETSINIITNLTGVAKRVCDVGMIAHFALFLPGDFFILRASLYHLTQLGKTGRYTPLSDRPPLRTIQDLDDMMYFIYTASALIGLLVIVILINFYGGGMNGETYSSLNSILGGLSGSLDTFIIPGACGLVFFSPKSYRYNESVVLIAVGLVCMMVIFVGTGLTIASYQR